jgi:DNA-binding transcriptional regulator YhcF (GntR family)
MELDPSDPRKRYQQVAGHLRASILTGDMNPGDRMPTVAELANEYGVSKTTIERAIDILKAEHLVVARQGAGTFVREPSTRPTGLRPHIETAFETDAVSIDFIGFSGETLHGAMTECLDKVRTGRYQPKSVTVRMILPDTSKPWSLPSKQDGTDSPEFRQRHQRTIDRYTGGLADIVDELVEHGLVEDGSVTVRVVADPPLSKLYLVNGTDAFFGWYAITPHKVKYDGKTIPVVDLMGKDTELLHFATGQPDQSASLFVSESQRFFEAQWNLVAAPLN